MPRSSRIDLGGPPGSPILDIGAGKNPHPQATHAIDRIPDPKFRGLNYTGEWNFKEREYLPYEDDSFLYVISSGGLGVNFGTDSLSLFDDTYRVLKPGGKLVLAYGPSWYSDTKEILGMMESVGFQTSLPQHERGKGTVALGVK